MTIAASAAFFFTLSLYISPWTYPKDTKVGRHFDTHIPYTTNICRPVCRRPADNIGRLVCRVFPA